MKTISGLIKELRDICASRGFRIETDKIYITFYDIDEIIIYRMRIFTNDYTISKFEYREIISKFDR